MNYLDELVKRFGKIENSAISTFGKDHFDGIQGWQFEEELITNHNRQGKLLTMDLDIPSACPLNCIYCFAKEDAYYRPQAGDKPLSLKRIMEIIKEAKMLGLKSIKVVGYGEPFENSEIYNFIRFATELDIHLVIFTAGYTFGKSFPSAQEAIAFLYQHKVSLMIKYHALTRAQEDLIVKKEGYAYVRDQNLNLLLDHGFAGETPTRLGLENVIAIKNIQELAAIYEYFKIFCNIHVDIDPPIPVGRTKSKQQSEEIGLKEKALLQLYKLIYSINRRYDIPSLGVSPFIGNPPCSQLPNGIYLTLSGKVMSCCGGSEEYGNVNKGESLEEIFQRNPYRLRQNSIYHDCPYRAKAKILDEKFLSRVRKAIG